MKGLIVLPLYLLLCVIPSVCLAQSAYLHSSEIIEGDIATLVVEYQNNLPSLFYLDTSPLEKSFQVLDVRPNVTLERVNNRILNTMHWEIQIYPKKNWPYKDTLTDYQGNFNARAKPQGDRQSLNQGQR